MNLQNESELTNYCFNSGIDEIELEYLLMQLAGRMTKISPTELIVYEEENDLNNFVLKLAYSKKDQLTKIIPGPKFTDDKSHYLCEQINCSKNNNPDTTGSIVFFSFFKTTGWHRIDDYLQIRPVPEDKPQPPGFAGSDGFPGVLEFRFCKSNNCGLSILREQRIQNEICLLLHLLVEGNFHPISIKAAHHWVWLPRKVESENLSSGYCQTGYPIQKLPNANDFSVINSDAEKIEQVAPEKYYDHSHGRSLRKLTLPTNLGDSIKKISISQCGLSR